MTASENTQPHWPVALGLAAIHLGALAALLPSVFSWSALAIMFLLWYLTLALGVSLSYHRLLTHRSLKLPKWLEYALALMGTLSLQGGPIQWVATHRIHHAHTDKDGDPHDSRRGLAWAHVEWLYRPNEARPSDAQVIRYAPDLYGQAYYRWLDAAAVPLQVALALVLFVLGGVPWVIWGIFVRLVIVYHITWLVNSAAHMHGYRSFATEDRSKNCWWVGLLTWGEGWHNNHHAFPFSARHGLRWFEFDPSWMTIKLLRMLRIATNVKLPTIEMQRRMAVDRAGRRD